RRTMPGRLMSSRWSEACEWFWGKASTIMRIGIIGPPFIEIPPRRYGGTELFIANLASALDARGHDVTVYGNGDSRLSCKVKWRYPHAEWPLTDLSVPYLKNEDHTSWAIHDAAGSVDVLHLNDI